MSLNKRMGDKHEADMATLFGGRPSRGSGNQWSEPADGRVCRYAEDFAFAYDCKSTLGKSIGVSRQMWRKIVEQSFGERPMLPLRFYDTDRLDIGLDLVVVGAHDFAEMREVACGH